MIAFLLLLQSSLSGTATVVDGDTLRLAGEPARIRLWGIDAPETSTAAGREASAFLQGVVIGETIQCTPEGHDRYGRIVARCRSRDGDLGQTLISQGYAEEWCRYSQGYYGGCGE